MKTVIALVLILCNFHIYSQSFEGTLIYKVTFEFSSKFNNDEFINKTLNTLKKSGEYYDTLTIKFKGGNYLKMDNAPNGKKVIYHGTQNQLYFFTKNSDIVLIADANMYHPNNIKLPEPQVILEDSIFNINRTLCKKIKFVWEDIGEEIYYYSTSIAPLKPYLFREHNYEYLNLLISLTKAYPVKIVKSLNEFITINIELVDVNNSKIENNIFEIPLLREPNKKQAEMINQLSGYDIMVIRE